MRLDRGEFDRMRRDHELAKMPPGFRWRDMKEFMSLVKEDPASLRADPDAPEWMCFAAMEGRVDLLRTLVELGMGVDDPAGPRMAELLDPGLQARVPLEFAAVGGCLDAVRFLVEQGASLVSPAGERNAATLAEEFGKYDVRDYLQSVGMRTLRESTPPDYPAAHAAFLKATTDRLGPLGAWRMEIPGEPHVTLHHIPASEKHPAQTLFTRGLSDRPLPRGRDPLACLELLCLLPPTWPLDAAALADPCTNWPVVWLERLVGEVRAAERWPESASALFMNGDPPAPLAPDTALCGWMCLRASESSVDVPDLRRIDVYTLHPIHAQEQRLIQSAGFGVFMEAMVHLRFPRQVDPQRPNFAVQG